MNGGWEDGDEMARPAIFDAGFASERGQGLTRIDLCETDAVDIRASQAQQITMGCKASWMEMA